MDLPNQNITGKQSARLPVCFAVPAANQSQKTADAPVAAIHRVNMTKMPICGVK